MRKTLEEAIRDGDEWWFKDDETEQQYMESMFLRLLLSLGMFGNV